MAHHKSRCQHLLSHGLAKTRLGKLVRGPCLNQALSVLLLAACPVEIPAASPTFLSHLQAPTWRVGLSGPALNIFSFPKRRAQPAGDTCFLMQTVSLDQVRAWVLPPMPEISCDSSAPMCLHACLRIAPETKIEMLQSPVYSPKGTTYKIEAH